MLAVAPLRSDKNERENQIQGFSSMEGNNEFNLLDTIDFDDFFMGINDGDVLPDLEMDPDFSSVEKLEENGLGENGGAAAASVSGSDVGSGSDSVVVNVKKEKAVEKGEKGKKSSGNSKRNPPGKKKVKVDWTPELHRRFVEAVEQLGLDKAVPSRILELMGVDSLTRHNVASHLQKYRSHRKHLLAREAEAASWSQRRQMYGTAAPAGKIEVNPWIAPTMGFPPVTPMPHYRPLLHVWGHPSMDQSLMHTWPKYLAPPPHAWPPLLPPHQLPPSTPADPSFWAHRQHVPIPVTPCFAPHFPPTRFPTPPVHGVPPPAMYKVDPAGQTLPAQPPFDVQPSKESIDAAIGDVLAKPWLPLPLGLKPPSIDSVMAELQCQGVSKIPPTCH